MQTANLKLILVIAGIYFSIVAVPASGDHLLTTHKLSCSKDFPCPAELQGRIDFWIQVFRKWSRTEAIFHDPDAPERVYSIVDTGEGCGSSGKVRAERKAIKTRLYNTAQKMESGAEMTRSEKHYAALFHGARPSDLRRASENIRCQSGVKESYLGGLERFNQYSYMVDTTLAQYELPPDIRYLPFVESSYNPAAYSKAGAAGMWQIMPSTARVLGLELNASIDERLDPEAATAAAARYLVNARRSLTELARTIDPSIKDEDISPFIITSYNYGVNGMRRAIRQVRPDYLSVLDNYKSPAFQVAVKNFYSSFLAARHVTINSGKYFGDVVGIEAQEFVTVVLRNATSVERIVSVFGVSEEALKPVNLGLTRFVWNGWRLIPPGYQLNLPWRQDGYASEIAMLESLPVETVAPGSESYVVRKGDTACGIARALQVNCQELIRMNRLGKRALIRVGQKLEIPGRLVAVKEQSDRGPDKTVVVREPAQEASLTYKVRKGDTACVIASRNNVSCRQLIAVNNLGRRATIYIGQNLVIPGKTLVTGQVAGLDENNRYLVLKGDTACGIARQFSVSCNDLKSINNLNKKAVIHPGQRLSIPGLQVPDTTETVEQLAQVEAVIDKADEQLEEDSTKMVTSPGLSNLLDTLPDLSVSVTESNGQPVYRIWVEADESLGHYADWLGDRSANQIRSLNKLTRDQLRIGQLLQLPVESGFDVENFENRRIEYHTVLSEELKSHYDLVGVKKYTVQPGDSVWTLSRDSGFPVWLFYRLNPQYKVSGLRVGQTVLIPRLQEI